MGFFLSLLQFWPLRFFIYGHEWLALNNAFSHLRFLLMKFKQKMSSLFFFIANKTKNVIMKRFQSVNTTEKCRWNIKKNRKQ